MLDIIDHIHTIESEMPDSKFSKHCNAFLVIHLICEAGMLCKLTVESLVEHKEFCRLKYLDPAFILNLMPELERLNDQPERKERAEYELKLLSGLIFREVE